MKNEKKIEETYIYNRYKLYKMFPYIWLSRLLVNVEFMGVDRKVYVSSKRNLKLFQDDLK